MKVYKLVKVYLGSNIKKFVLYLFLCIISSVVGVCMPYLTGGFIDSLLLYKNRNILFYFCFFLLFLTIGKMLIGYFLMILFSKLQVSMAYKFNMDIIKHIQDIPIQQIKEQNLVYLNNKINNDCNAVIIYCLNTIQEIIMVIVNNCVGVILEHY